MPGTTSGDSELWAWTKQSGGQDPYFLKHLNLYFITVDEHFDCHLLHPVLDAFEHLQTHAQTSLSSSVAECIEGKHDTKHIGFQMIPT